MRSSASRTTSPGVLDHRREANQGRVLRLLYLLGASDGGAAIEEMPAMLDGLVEGAEGLRARMAEPARRRRKVR